MVLDHHVLALYVARFVESFTERSAKARGILGRSGADKADDRHRRLLRSRGERPPRRRAAEERDELAPPHIGPPPPESAYGSLNLTQGGWRVLRTDLNCSERGRLLPRRPTPNWGSQGTVLLLSGSMSLEDHSRRFGCFGQPSACPL